jgi:small GTP-binding protein
VSTLVESISQFFGRVEVLARGADADRRAAEVALERRRPLEAREWARLLLEKVPGSPIGLALWADAAEDAWLDHEVIEALGELVKTVPWRADVWLRIGRAGLRVGRADAREALERAATAPEERESARLALLELCDLDLAMGDAERASRWLDRVPVSLSELDRDVALRRAECALFLGDLEQAKGQLERIGPEGPDEIDGRRSLAWARLAWQSGGATEGTLMRGEAVALALRALLLDVVGAGDLVAALVASSRDAAEVALLSDVVKGLGLGDEPRFAAAFAFAEGRKDDARKALARALASGDERAALALLSLAVETRDLGALGELASSRPALLSRDHRALYEASAQLEAHRAGATLEALDGVGADAAAWAHDLRKQAFATYTKPDTAAWADILGELHRAAHALSSLGRVTEVEALAMEQQRPLRLAIVGEFNAGKSTFINALLGVDVAPTGVLPTTATLHWVAWAPDPFARVVVRGAADRVVPHAELKNALKGLEREGARVERVYIYAPIERLRHVEILDTPGFNAPDPEHARAARTAFDEAHVVVWLLDAGGAMKASERDVLREVRSAGIPTLVLLNKADRLKPDDLRTVLEHVRASLAEEHLEGYREPLALSARLALAARLGDASQLEASGWPRVEALLEESVVDRADTLRERGMRRKALAIAEALLAEASARQETEVGKRDEALARASALRQAAAKLGHEAWAIAESVTHAVEPALRTLEGDLRPLSELSPEARKDDGLRRYLIDRLVARLGPALSAEICRAASVAVTDETSRAVAATLAGAAAVLGDQGAELELGLFRSVVRAAVASVSIALSAEAARPVGEPPSAITRARLAALAEVLRGAP